MNTLKYASRALSIRTEAQISVYDDAYLNTLHEFEEIAAKAPHQNTTFEINTGKKKEKENGFGNLRSVLEEIFATQLDSKMACIDCEESERTVNDAIEDQKNHLNNMIKHLQQFKNDSPDNIRKLKDQSESLKGDIIESETLITQLQTERLNKSNQINNIDEQIKSILKVFRLNA